MTITYTKNHQGAWILSTVHGGYLVTRSYYGYTKRESARLFREELTA